jgi:cytoskeletal protein CcmA (bactofilin family)
MFRDQKKQREDTPSARTEWTAPQTQLIQEEPKAMNAQRDPYTVPSSSAADLNALLGRGIEFEGKLAFQGMVRIDGKFTGQITTSDTLVIGEGARVSAEISCGSIIVHGEVTGNIRAKESVELHKPARVKGDISTPALMIEKGVTFQGVSKMEDLERDFSKSGSSAKSGSNDGARSDRAIRETTVTASAGGSS